VGLKVAWLGCPLTCQVVVEAKSRTIDGEAYLTGLTRLEIYLLEGFEFLDGTLDLGRSSLM
jgi:hypothetical protein